MLRKIYQVLVASNFAEFSSLRACLREHIDTCPVPPLRAVDLDDDRARHQTPLHVSMETARRSDILVLLVGREYGGCPPDEPKSYAHLEYEAAFSAGERVVILPYLYGWRSVEESWAAEDPRLASWCREIYANHTVRSFLPGTNQEMVVSSVRQDIQAAVFDQLNENQRRDLDTLDAVALTTDSGPSRAELERLTSTFAEDGAETISRDGDGRSSTEEALRAPARVAALEQRQQAFQALDLGERAVAVAHLRRALELIPLDSDTCYWLARLLVRSGRRQACHEAEDLGRRAAKVAQAEGRPLHLAASLLVASRAAARLDEHRRAIEGARSAVEAAGWYAEAHAELGTRLAEAGEFEEGFESISAAFFRHPSIALRVLRRETIFLQNPEQVRPYLAQLSQRVQTAVADVLRTEKAFARGSVADEASGGSATDQEAGEEDQLSSAGLLKQLSLARESVNRQMDYLKVRVRNVRSDFLHYQTAAAKAKSEAKALREKQAAVASALARKKPEVERVILAFSLGLALLFAASQGSWRALGTLVAIVLLANLGHLLYQGRALTIRRKELPRRQAAALEDLERSLRPEVEAAAERAREAAQDFQDAVRTFERAALRWSILSPTRGLATARAGDLLRLDPRSLPKNYTFRLCPDVLPPDLQKILEVPVEASDEGHHLFRVITRSGDSIDAACWACFSEVPSRTPLRPPG